MINESMVIYGATLLLYFTQMLAKNGSEEILIKQNQADILPVIDGMLIFIKWFQDVPGLWQVWLYREREREKEKIEKGDAFHYDVRFLLGKSPFTGMGMAINSDLV